jgi:membrane protease YdiL (CAAX protease family)
MAITAVGLVAGAMWTEQTSEIEAAELQFQNRMLQGQIRMQEGLRMLAMEHGEELPAWPDQDALIEATRTVALMTLPNDAPGSIKQTAAAMWLILKLSQPREAVTSDAKQTAVSETQMTARLTRESPIPRPRLDASELALLDEMLTTTSASDTLAESLRTLAQGNPINRLSLNATETTSWLRRRLIAQSLYPNGPLQRESNLLNEEREYIERAIVLQTGIALFSITGLLLILLFFLKRATPKLPSNYNITWQSDWWLGWYVPLAWFLSYQAISLAVMQIGQLVGIAAGHALGLQLIAQALSLAAALWLIARFTNGASSITEVVYRLQLGLSPLNGKVLKSLGYAIATVAVASPIVMLTTQMTELLPIQAREHAAILEIMETSEGSRNYLAELSLLLTITVGAPFCEETIFRGFMYRHIRARAGIKAGVVLSALAFACVHGSLASLLPLFALGVLLALVVEWSGGILPAMIAHGLWNLYQLAVPLVILAP